SAAAQPGIDQRLAVADLADSDRARLNRSVGSDNPDVGAFRPLLYRGRGDGQAIVARVELEPRIDQFARPQHPLGIGKARAQPDRAGGLDDLIVDEIELTLVELRLVVLAVGKTRE